MIAIRKKRRRFLPEDLQVNTWDDLKPYADNLLNRKIRSISGFEKFLRDESEFSAAYYQEYIDRDILVMQDSTNKEYEKDFLAFHESSHDFALFDQAISKRIADDPYGKQIKDKSFRKARKSIKLFNGIFCPQNIRLENKDTLMSYKVGRILSRMTMIHEDREINLSESAALWSSGDREERKKAWLAEQEARLEKSEPLGRHFGRLVANRHQMGLNAGFDDYTDYVYWNAAPEGKQMVYLPKDMRRFDNNVKNIVLPIIEKLDKKRADKLGLRVLRPWDLDVDIYTQKPVVAFKNKRDLLKKTHKVLNAVDPYFSDVLKVMEEHGHMDLEPRDGKYPGACNYNMPERMVPYTFGNFSGSINDVATMVHETGHGVQNMLLKDLKLARYKWVCSDVAEFAAIGMEMLSFDHWGEFFDNKTDCLRAQRVYLENIMRRYFPYIAEGNKFQRAVYAEPDISPRLRNEKYLEISQEYNTPLVDWSGLEDYQAIQWQRKPHPFTDPFYFAEYSFAFIAAADLLKNYRKQPDKTIEQYKKALGLGSTETISKTFETAGVNFDFDAPAMRRAAKFYYNEICEIDKKFEEAFDDDDRDEPKVISPIASSRPPKLAA